MGRVGKPTGHRQFLFSLSYAHPARGSTLTILIATWSPILARCCHREIQKSALYFAPDSVAELILSPLHFSKTK